MSTTQPSPPLSARHQRSPGARAEAYAAIIKLARTAHSRHTFFAQALNEVADVFDSPYGVISVRHGSQVTQEDCHRGETDPAFWRDDLQRFLAESLVPRGKRVRILNPKQQDSLTAFIAAPVVDPSGATVGALALVVTDLTREDLRERLIRLESLVALMSSAVELVGAGRDARSDGGSTATMAVAHAAGLRSPEELAFTITNNLRNKTNCEQIAMGVVTRGHVTVLSISGQDHVAHQSDGVAHLRAAMEECLDIGEPIVCQDSSGLPGEPASHGYRIHQQWRAAAKGDAVASIPLRDGDDVIAVLALRRRADQPFTDEQVERIRASVEPYAVALGLVRDANRGLVRHTVEAASDAVGAIARPGRRGAKIAAAAAVLAAVWFIFGSVDYRLTVPCAVAPATLRHVSIPFDAILSSADVVAGDRVKQGDVLCRLDTRDLDQQRAEVFAQIAVLESQRTNAMGDDDPAGAQLALANQKLAQARLAIVENRIERATLRAPIDGVVVAGDLRKHIGSVLAQGDPLYEIAPADGWELELAVPESSVTWVTADAAGRFAPLARPEQSQAFRIRSISPQAQVRGRTNVFVAEAQTDVPAAWMRPGMEGIAKISIGRRPVWWATLHRAIDYLRMTLWL